MRRKVNFFVSLLCIFWGIEAGRFIFSNSKPAIAVDKRPCGSNAPQVQYETQDYLIYICPGSQQKSPLYVGVQKSNASKLVQLPAQKQENGYVAIKGNTTYSINPFRLLVTQNGTTVINQAVISGSFGISQPVTQTRYNCYTQSGSLSPRLNVSQAEAQKLSSAYQCYPKSK